MRHLMLLCATAALVLSPAPAQADLGDQLFKFLPDDGAAGDLFGFSVAISAPTAIVGAYQDTDNGQASGSAYFFDAASPPRPDGDGDGVTDDVDDCPGESGTAANNGCPEMDDT